MAHYISIFILLTFTSTFSFENTVNCHHMKVQWTLKVLKIQGLKKIPSREISGHSTFEIDLVISNIVTYSMASIPHCNIIPEKFLFAAVIYVKVKLHAFCLLYSIVILYINPLDSRTFWKCSSLGVHSVHINHCDFIYQFIVGLHFRKY